MMSGRPAVVATRTKCRNPKQLPPIACAIGFASDRRLVCDESCALSSGWSTQPLAVESIIIARRKNITFLLSFFCLALVVVVFLVSVF